MRTRCGCGISASARRHNFAIEAQQFYAFGDLIASGEEEGLHAARDRGVDGAFHLHGFKNHKGSALLDLLAWLNEQCHNAARHGGDEAAFPGVVLAAEFERIVECEDMVFTVEEHVHAMVGCHDSGLQAPAIDDGMNAPVIPELSADGMDRMTECDLVVAGTVLDDCSGVAVVTGEDEGALIGCVEAPTVAHGPWGARIFCSPCRGLFMKDYGQGGEDDYGVRGVGGLL